MEYKNFEQLLELASLNKKEFANISRIPYQTVVGWNNNGKTPLWVELFLENYIKAKDMDQIVNAVKPYIQNNKRGNNE